MSTEFRFCTGCAGPLELRTLRPGEPRRLVCARCGRVQYVDPKVAVGTIVHDDDSRVLLVRRAIEPGYGLWVFPGGYVDRGEPLEEAARREAREECGLEVRLEALVDCYSYPGRTPIIIVYSAAISAGVVCVDEEGLQAQWFSADEIPWAELAFPSTRDALNDYFDGRRHPLKSGR